MGSYQAGTEAEKKANMGSLEVYKGYIKLIWVVPKIRVTILGVPIIRTIIIGVLYWGPPILGKYHMGKLVT